MLAIDFSKEIKSDRVFLRALQESDFTEIQQLPLDQDMWYYFTADLSDKKILNNWLVQALEELNNQKSLPFVIIDQPTNKIIGTTRISNISTKDSRVEIGWTWLIKAAQNTGINAHVKQLLFKFLFEETPTTRIEFKTDVLNIAARKGMLKAGLVEEGILRSHTLMTNNRRRDTIYYSILKEEWQGLYSGKY